MKNNNEVEVYERAIKALIEDQYPNLIGKDVKVIEIGEHRIRFGISMPFASYSVSKEVLNKYINE